jgi:hypothetical protein
VVWDVTIEQDRRYRIWRVTEEGDTLVASMGRWRLERKRDKAGEVALCLTPVRRDPLCGPVALTQLGEDGPLEWRFADTVASNAFGWLAYPRGAAPWDPLDPPRTLEIHRLRDVTVKPRLLGCSEPLRLPPDEPSPQRVTARFVVEPDGGISALRIVTAASEPARQAAVAIVRSCRFAAGELVRGKPVRVLVELPLNLEN